MEISLNVILDELTDYECHVFAKTIDNRKFEKAELLIEAMKEFNPESVYIGTISQWRTIRTENADFWAICINDCEEDLSLNEQDNIIVVEGDPSVLALYARIQSVFSMIDRWVLKVQNAIIKGSGIEEIMDMGAPVLKSYMQITDSAFKLIAYTSNVDCDDEITILAREYGYHPESTVKKFNKYGRLGAWKSLPDVFVNTNREFTKYDLISRVFRFSNNYFAHCVLVCNERPLTKGLIELFEIFMNSVGILIEKDWISKNTCNHIYDSFLTDILDGMLLQRELLEERARYVTVPLDGTFAVGVIDQDESGTKPSEMVGRELDMLLPNDKVVIYNGQVVFFAQLSKNGYLEQFQSLRDRLEPLLEKWKLRCGLSGFFNDMLDARKAFEQARMALRCSGKTPGAGILPTMEGASNGLQRMSTSFDESYFYIMLRNGPENRELWRNSVYYTGLKQLQEYDKAHNLNNLQLLYVYLINERKSNETGIELHMSRNNVIYRIGRIEDMLNMDLNNASVRLKLLISYTMMQLYTLD